jgi:RNA polymerase sigma factor (sigma-70 family)
MTEREFKIEILPLSKKVYPLAFRMLGSQEAARDAVQQAMLKLWEKRKQLNGCTNVQAFVFTVVRNICLDELKRKKPVIVEEPGKVIQMYSDFGKEYEGKEVFAIIEKIIGSLSPQQKEVISLRDLDGMEFEEIAEIMKIEITYVRVLLSRARKTVREEMKRIYAYDNVKSR